jgi:hypothetical protein
MRLLSEDIRTDRTTDMVNFQYILLKLAIEKVLRIIVAFANHLVVPEVTTISHSTLPCKEKYSVIKFF